MRRVSARQAPEVAASNVGAVTFTSPPTTNAANSSTAGVQV
jgi:hypothetical protein